MVKLLNKLILVGIIMLFSTIVLYGQKAYTLQDFKTEIVDTVSLPKVNSSINTYIPKSSEDKLWQEYSEGKRTISRPLYHKGVVFPANGLKYAFDATTGEKIFYGSKEAKERFKDWDTPYVCIREFGKYSPIPSIVDILTGQIIDKRSFEERSFEAHLVKENTLIVDQGRLKLISLPNKSVLWEKEHVFDKGAIISEELVFLSSRKGSYIYAYDKLTGEECWSVQFGRESLLAFKLDEQVLYIGTSKGFYAIDVSNAKEPAFKWKYQKGYVLDVTYDKEKIYVFNERPYAIDKGRGHIAWKSEAFLSPDRGKLSVTENYLLGSGYEPESAATNTLLDKKTGKVLGTTSYFTGIEEKDFVPADTYYAEFGEGDTLCGMANENGVIIAVKLDYLDE